MGTSHGDTIFSGRLLAGPPYGRGCPEYSPGPHVDLPGGERNHGSGGEGPTVHVGVDRHGRVAHRVPRSAQPRLPVRPGCLMSRITATAPAASASRRLRSMKGASPSSITPVTGTR